MSIRKKLIISNIIMVLIPIIFILILNSVLLQSYRKKRMETQRINQKYVIDILPLLELKDKIVDMNELISFCRAIEQNGGSVFLTEHGSIIYKSDDYSARSKEVTEFINDYSSINQFLITSESGFELYIKTEINNMELSILSDKVIPNYILMGNLHNREFENSMRQFTIILLLSTLCIIILTNGILTVIVSRSVLNPLNILRDGTNRIKHGNLEQEVVYNKNDEFGAVCADFEQMRLRLRQSVFKQKNYEDSRKELIAGISHDLLTPLARIKGHVSGILDGVANTPEKINYYLNVINSSSDTMKKMVDDLFLLSKLDIKSIPFYFECTNIVPYFVDCCEELKPELTKQEFDLFLETSSDEIFVMLEKAQFQRAVLNIIDNSVKYKKEGRGRLTIKIQKNSVDVIISFEDCGIGVDEDKVMNIFNIFYRTDVARSETQKGSGLGLAIVKQIVELHNGHVAAYSKKGEGLTITVTIPNARA